MDAVSEEEKLEATNKMRDHVMNAQKERDLYNSCIKRAKDSQNLNQQDRYNHCTFDFSQNISIPHHSRQMGPIYFTTPRKIQLFGVRIDGEPKQLNFLIDENETLGLDGTKTHGPDAVISMVDWALETFGRDERTCAIHADNCPGQNKNQFVIGYFMWRVMTGQHETIEYHMQVPGHARCLVDSGFAHIKKLYRRSDCDTLEQMENVVCMSAATNTAVRYPAWRWRNLKRFLSQNFKSVPGIRKYQYFKFSSGEPGTVVLRQSVDSEEVRVNILKDVIS